MRTRWLLCALVAIAGCAPKRSPELVATRYANARIVHRCERAWGLLARKARVDSKKAWIARCESGKDSLLVKEMIPRTTFEIVDVQAPSEKRRVVVLRFDAPDPTAAFTESFQHEVMNIGDDVRDILSGGSIGAPSPTPTPRAPRPAAPALSDPASDAWLAEQISKPGAPRIQVEHSFVLVRTWGEWRIAADPLPLVK